jgi:hypothetical protein
MQLVWNDLECGWVCSECGAIYGEEEVARMFQFSDQIPKNFMESYCMDCGGCFTEAIKK